MFLALNTVQSRTPAVPIGQVGGASGTRGAAVWRLQYNRRAAGAPGTQHCRVPQDQACAGSGTRRPGPSSALRVSRGEGRGPALPWCSLRTYTRWVQLNHAFLKFRSFAKLCSITMFISWTYYSLYFYEYNGFSLNLRLRSTQACIWYYLGK